MRKEFLLRGLKGEFHMLDKLPFMTGKDVDTKKPRLEIASEDYDINPFGKLVREPAKYHARGHILEHKKYYHGFFMNLKCTEEFYDKHKEEIEPFICDEDWISRDHQPVWF